MKYFCLFALLTIPYCTYTENELPEEEIKQEALYTLQEQSIIEPSQDADSIDNNNSKEQSPYLQKFEENFDALMSEIILDPRKQALKESVSKQIVMRYLSEHLKNGYEQSKNRPWYGIESLFSGSMSTFREGSTFIIQTLIAPDLDEINNPKETNLKEEKNLLKYKILLALKKNEDQNSKIIKLDKNTKCTVRFIANQPTIECMTFVSKKQFKMALQELKEKNNPISIPESEVTPPDEDNKYNAIFE